MASWVCQDPGLANLILKGGMDVAVNPQSRSQLANQGVPVGDKRRTGQGPLISRIDRLARRGMVRHDDRCSGTGRGLPLTAEPVDGGAVVSVRVTRAKPAAGPQQVDAPIVVHVCPAGRHGLGSTSREEAEIGPEGAAEEPNVTDLNRPPLKQIDAAPLWGRRSTVRNRVTGSPQCRKGRVQVAIIEFMIARYEEDRNVRKRVVGPPQWVGPSADVAR